MRATICLLVAMICAGCTSPPPPRPAAGEWVICNGEQKTLREETFVTLAHAGDDDLTATLHGLTNAELGVETSREVRLTLQRSAEEPGSWLSQVVPVPGLGTVPRSAMLLIPSYEHVRMSEDSESEYRLSGVRYVEAGLKLEIDVDYGGQPALRVHCLHEGSIQTYPIRLR